MTFCINKIHARRTRIFSEQECDPVTVLVCIKLTLLMRKSCNVHMTEFEIIVHHNVDNWIQSWAFCILAQTTHPHIVN